nr:MAG TPA: integral membrane protein [Bacteriophage sp.]DAM06380.1 MAG TPA: integral membrane protein [Caudoviricetes sp.]DAQ53113.1 MAG TPA: integral membrane protein [Caudoviricetes sp.]DAT18746.1 MAG TPA: integral membrane protein [Caudoviricetes sp.]
MPLPIKLTVIERTKACIEMLRTLYPWHYLCMLLYV